MAHQSYAKFDDLPLGELVPLTAFTGEPDKYDDYGEGSFCSTCGKNSSRRARADLWMMRRDWGGTYHTRFYCRDHFPNSDNGGEGRAQRSRAAEVTCPNCYVRTPPVDECGSCGALLPVE